MPVLFVKVIGRAPGCKDAKNNFTPPPDSAVPISELDQHSSDHTVTKLRPDAFFGTSQEQFLRRRGITQILLCGVATSIGVESTARMASARMAYDLGFNVSLVVNAMSVLNAEVHAHSVERIFPRIVEVGQTQDLIDLLADR